MAAASGELDFGLRYPIVVAVATAFLGCVFVPETEDRVIERDAPAAASRRAGGAEHPEPKPVSFAARGPRLPLA